MRPSSSTSSLSTPAGWRPARRARSTAASVWPGRSSTPSGAGAQREDVARAVEHGGRAGRVGERSQRGRTVGGGDAGGGALGEVDRDGEGGAELVGVGSRAAPSAAVPGGRMRSPGSAAQMTPEVWRTKNAMASGVAASAAMMRSPSFSRCSSSATTTMPPAAMAAMAASMGSNALMSGRSRRQRLLRAAARRTWPSRRPRCSPGRPGRLCPAR